MKHNVLLLGSDINVYYMARCHYERYEEPIDVIGTEPMRFTQFSSIMNIEYHSDLRTDEGFVNALTAYGEAHKEEGKTLLVPCHDVYVRLVVDNFEKISEYFIYNGPSKEIVDSFLDKEKFYKTYAESGLPFARTIYYDCSVKETEMLPVDIVFPLIIKPGDAISYGKHPFPGQPKVYKANTPQKAIDFIDKVKAAGYTGTLLVQEFIPGDDTHLFDCVMYVNSKGKAEFATFAQIGLQEHNPTAIGNCTVLINGYNRFGKTEETVEKLKNFMEKIGYRGFAEFDLKYNENTQEFMVMEINPRQARSSYYVAALGRNLISVLQSDVFDGEEHPFELLDKEILLSMVPKKVIKNYIADDEYKAKALSLWKAGKKVNPLSYKGDRSFKHHVYLAIRAVNYNRKYKNNKNTI